jgi:hypothetical protein
MMANEDNHTSYEISTLKKQIAELEAALNEVRGKLGMSAIQLPKSAHQPHS